MKENLLTRIFGGGEKKAAEPRVETRKSETPKMGTGALSTRPKPKALINADYQPDYSKPEWNGFVVSDMASRQSMRSGYTSAMREIAEIYRIVFPLLDNGEIGKAKQVLAEAFRWVPDVAFRNIWLEEFSQEGGSL